MRRRRRWSSCKATTSDCYRLDVRWLQREGLLLPGRYSPLTWSCNGEPPGSINLRSEIVRVILSYRHRRLDESWQEREYSVTLEWTRCHYGGSRPWFRCPANGCGRRVTVLYGGGIYAYRQCHQLVYESKREPPYRRALSRAQAIIKRLGGTWAEGFPDKPKGMHHGTYRRLAQQSEYAQACSWAPSLLNALHRG